MNPPRNELRRRLTLAALAVPVLPMLPGCSAPLGELTHSASATAAATLLEESAAAQGSRALAGINDISVKYSGRWHGVVGRLQPALIDPDHRGVSEERLLLATGSVGQSYTGPGGHKQVMRQTRPGGPGEVHVWFNDLEASDAERRAAAALVADGYSLFLLGPMLLAGPWSRARTLVMELEGRERISQDGRKYDCDVLRISIQPGLGFSTADQLALFIDTEQRLMRRVRFTLNGLDSTRGALAEVDLYDHRMQYGVRWPTRFYERLLRPLPLPVHNWKLEGLDVNRGLSNADISGSRFSGMAERPAAPLA